MDSFEKRILLWGECTMKRKENSLWVLLVTAIILCTCQPVCADLINQNNYYTWGIDENELVIQNGSIVTEAVLTVHNVTSANENINDTLNLYLIDKPLLGFVANGNLETAPFSQTGLLLTPAYQDTVAGTENLVYRFSDMNDPSSHFWNIFSYPVIFGINSALTIDSSLILETIDYAGNKTPFGFGFDLQGTDSFTFDSITLELTIESFENQVSRHSITFTTDLLTPIGNRSVNENQLLTFVVNQTEPHGDLITYAVQNLPEGATYTNRTFAWTPTKVHAGDHLVTFTADNGSLQDSETVTITVNSFNTAPVLTAIGSKTIDENALLTFALSATDADADPIVYSAQNLPTGAVFTGTTFAWTPDYTQSGTYLLTFLANDGQATDSETITITVNDINTTPVLASIANRSVDENALLTFGVTATDADGDALTYSAQNLPVGAAFTNTTFTWTPTYDQGGTYYVTFNATDGILTDSQTVTITVNNTNRAPVMTTIDDRSVNETATLTINVFATDGDADALTFNAQNMPAGATFNANTFTWTPTYDQAGIYSVTFNATDGQATDSQTVTITVNNVNRNPVLTAIPSKSVNENSTLTFSINASDPDGTNVTYSMINAPAGAALTGNTFTWTPSYAQNGTYYVTFTASDGLATDSETVTITVYNVNRGPVLTTIGNKTTSENSPLTFSVNATDADGDGLIYSAGNLPAGAAFIGNTFSWLPGYNQAGTYTVTFYVTDGTATDAETITITVNNTNRAPVLATINDRTVDEDATLTFNISATDADGDTLTYFAQNLPASAVFSGNTFTWTPAAGQGGTYSVTFGVTDTKVADTQTTTITVNAVGNHAPVLDHIDDVTVNERNTIIIYLNATDADGDWVTYSAQNMPENAVLNGNKFIWRPWYTDAGVYNVTFFASDGELQDSQTVTLTVKEVKLASWYERWLIRLGKL